MKCRFHISHLEVLNRDGGPVRVPWSQVRPTDWVLGLPRVFRQEHPGTPSHVCVGGRAAAVARRLCDRAQWRELDQPLKWPSVGRVLGTFGTWSVAMFAAMTCPVWLQARRGPLVPSDEWAAMTPEVCSAYIVVLVLWLLMALLTSAVPLWLFGPYLAFRIRNRGLRELRVTSEALVTVDQDGAETHWAWANLAWFNGRGQLAFRSRPGPPIQVYVFDKHTWRLVRERLKRIHPPAYRPPSMKKQFIQAVGALMVSAVCAELALPSLMRALGAEPVAPGRIIGVGGLLVLVGGLNAWLRLRFEKSRPAVSRHRRPGRKVAGRRTT